MFLGKPDERRRRGRPRKRWYDDMEEDLERMGIRNWKSKAMDRDEWSLVIEEAKVLQGL